MATVPLPSLENPKHLDSNHIKNPTVTEETVFPRSQLISALSENEKPQPTPRQKKVPHVMVVGAGIAGLRAASVLQRHGIKVTILEGRDRIGGRIYTARKPGKAPRDIGKYNLTYL